jgi:murein endopeptidase
MTPWIVGIMLANSDWGPHLDATDEWIESIAIEETNNCSTQRLHDGVKLPDRDDIYTTRRSQNTYGTQRTIDVITSAAEEVAWLVPEADPLVIGDISKSGGGPLSGHLSHRGGIDVDIGLFYNDGEQSDLGFITLKPDQLDVENMWILIRALLDTGEVERILLDKSLIQVLREYVIESGELSPKESLSIFPYVTGKRAFLYDSVVHHHSGHKHHIHVRIRCD